MDPDSYLCRLADLFDGVTVTAPTIGAIIAILLAVLLLYASGFVSASEIAFFSLSPVDLSEIEEGKHTSDRRISALLNDSERLLATILISNNFVNVTIIMLCNYFFATHLFTKKEERTSNADKGEKNFFKKEMAGAALRQNFNVFCAE